MALERQEEGEHKQQQQRQDPRIQRIEERKKVASEFRTAAEWEDDSKELCSRCVRLGRPNPGKAQFPKRAFCEWCEDVDMKIGLGEV